LVLHHAAVAVGISFGGLVELQLCGLFL